MLGIYLGLSYHLHFTNEKVETSVTCVLKSHNLELAEVGFEPWSVWLGLLHYTFIYSVVSSLSLPPFSMITGQSREVKIR